MSRLSYIILALIVLGLGIYVFRPDPDRPVNQTVKVFSGPAPTAYEVLANGLHQRVEGKTVSIGPVKLPLAEEVANGLWGQWTMIAVPSDKVIRGISAASFAAHDYGIDVTKRRLWGAGFDLSWGSANGEGYIADLLAGTVFSVGAEGIKQLDQSARRLDLGTPLPPGVAVAAVEASDVRVVQRDGHWSAVGAPMRPDFRRRVEALMRLAGGVRLADLNGTLPADAVPVTSVRLELDSQGAALAGLPAIYVVQLSRTAQGGTLALNQLPVQRISGEDLAVWQAAAAAFSEDRLFNIGDAFSACPVERVEVERGGKPWFRLESSASKDLDDFASRWDVVWDGGREFADPTCAQTLVDALNDLAVRDVRVRLALEEPWPDALRVTLLGKGIHGPLLFELRGREVRSASHSGRAVRLPDLLEHLAPDRFLDTMLAGRSPERVLKIQRRFLDRQPAVEEVLTRDSRGGWQRTWPRSEPIDAVAVQRIARAISTGRARAARMATAADRASADAPAFEIAVRFGPKPAGKANDFTELEDTTTNDLALAMSRGVDGRWRALGVGTGTAYDLDDELVEQLRQDVAELLVLPLVPALVRRVQIGTAVATLVLVRSADNWQVTEGETTARANAVEVRRLLRDLAALTATRRGPGGALAVNEMALTVSLELPGFDRETERLLLQIGKPGMAGAGAEEVALFAESTRPGALEAGRAYVPAASVAGFTVDAKRFQVDP